MSMLRRYAVLALLALMLPFAAAAGESDVLYWMVSTDDSTVDMKDGSSPQGLAAYIASFGTSADIAARVRVTGGTEDTFLDLYYPGEGEYFCEHGDLGVNLDYFETATSGIKSPVDNYSAGSPEYSFIVEIGNVVWNGDDGSWTTIAKSEAASYAMLGDYIAKTLSVDIPHGGVWSPTAFTAVPEPSSGLLTLLGMALVALRRKRFGEEV